MRKWIIVGVVLLLLCVAGVVAVLNVNSYIARNKDYLISQAEQALGRKVSVDDVEVSLWNGIGFRLTNFAMSDDPAFSSAEFVRAKDLQVNLKFLPLLRRDVRVIKLILHNPAMSIIRNAKADFNFLRISKSRPPSVLFLGALTFVTSPWTARSMSIRSTSVNWKPRCRRSGAPCRRIWILRESSESRI